MEAGSWTLKMEACRLKVAPWRVWRPVDADSYQFDEEQEQDQDPHQSENSHPDPDLDPHRSLKRYPDPHKKSLPPLTLFFPVSISN
jgi:hypothetical protein